MPIGGYFHTLPQSVSAVAYARDVWAATVMIFVALAVHGGTVAQARDLYP
jgi:hypothetical protein